MVKLNRRAKYVGHRSFLYNVVVRIHRHTHTHTADRLHYPDHKVGGKNKLGPGKYLKNSLKHFLYIIGDRPVVYRH